MTREYGFEEHFWENNQINGYVVLMNRMKYAKQTCEKLKAVYESRVILEENYASQILCMTNVLQSCNETGQFGHALNIMDTQWENMANTHLHMATKLKQQIVLPLVELLHKQKQIRKELETNIKRFYNNRQLQSHCVLRALDRYNTECTKANELMQHGSRDEKQLAYKRSKTTIKQCFIAYEDSLADLESVAKQWNEQWQHTCKEFELLEVERLDFLKTNLQEFNQVFIDISELTIDAYKPINDELESLNVDEDLDFFVKEFGGSSVIPNAKDYFKLYMTQDKFKDNNDDETASSISKKDKVNDTPFENKDDGDDGHQLQLTENQEKLINKEDEKKENGNDIDNDEEEEEDTNDIHDDDNTIDDQDLINDKVHSYENQFMVGRLEIYNSDDESSDFDNSEDCYSEDYQYENIIENETGHINIENKDHLNDNQDTINNDSFHKDDINEQDFTHDHLEEENEVDDSEQEDDDQMMNNNTIIENNQQQRSTKHYNESNIISFDMMDENHTIPKELLENNMDHHHHNKHQYQHDNKDKLNDVPNDQKINDCQLSSIMNNLKNDLQQKNITPTKRNPKKLPEIKTQDSLRYKPSSSSSSSSSQQQQQQQQQNNIYINDRSSSSSPPPVPKHQSQASTNIAETISSSPIDIKENNNENIISPTSSLSSSSVHEELEDMLRQLEKQSKKPTYYNKVITSSPSPKSSSSPSSNKIRLSGVRQQRQPYSKRYSDKRLLEELSEKKEFENKLNNNASSSSSHRYNPHHINSRFDTTKTATSSSILSSSLAKNSLSIAKPIDKSNKWTLEEATQAMKQALPPKRHPLPKQPTDVRI